MKAYAFCDETAPRAWDAAASFVAGNGPPGPQTSRSTANAATPDANTMAVASASYLNTGCFSCMAFHANRRVRSLAVPGTPFRHALLFSRDRPGERHSSDTIRL
jgi:hypothetical protein